MFFRGQLVGKYKIVAPLGSGGFGSVFLAEDTWLDKKVALKVPHRQQNLDLTELLHEPRLLGSMSHPNIVTVLTAERQEGVFFIVMEYVAGETLETIIMREGALELTRALDFSVQIANAVDHAHSNNVIHRDLRPGNVLVSARDEPAHVEREYALALERLGYVVRDDPLGESLGHRRFADAGLTYEYGIVLRAAGEDANDA